MITGNVCRKEMVVNSIDKGMYMNRFMTVFTNIYYVFTNVCDMCMNIFKNILAR